MNGRVAVLQVQARQETVQLTQRAAHGQQLTKLCAAQERAGRLGRWDSHQGLRPEPQISRVPPQMAVSLMAKQPAALAPGASSLWWTRISPQGDVETPAPTGSTHLHTHHTHTQGLTRHMRQSPSLPPVRVLPMGIQAAAQFVQVPPSHWHRLRDEQKPALSLDLVQCLQ